MIGVHTIGIPVEPVEAWQKAPIDLFEGASTSGPSGEKYIKLGDPSVPLDS